MQFTEYSEIDNTTQTNSKVFFFEKAGFLGPFELNHVVRLETLRHALSEAIKEPQDDTRENPLDQLDQSTKSNILDRRVAHITSKLVYDLATEPEILDDVAELLGSNILFWMAETIWREPGHDGHIVKSTGQIWHIDVINAWIKGVHVSVAVTDMTLKHGCLQVIPGTHQYDVDLVALAEAGECDLTDGLSMVKLADRLHPENAPHQITSIEMKAGQYCFTRGGLWHGVSRNNDTRTRLGLVARFARTDVKIKDFAGNLIPCILVRGEDSHQLNLLKGASENP